MVLCTAEIGSPASQKKKENKGKNGPDRKGGGPAGSQMDGALSLVAQVIYIAGDFS